MISADTIYDCGIGWPGAGQLPSVAAEWPQKFPRSPGWQEASQYYPLNFLSPKTRIRIWVVYRHTFEIPVEFEGMVKFRLRRIEVT